MKNRTNTTAKSPATKASRRHTPPIALLIAAAALFLCTAAQALVLGINPAGTTYSSIIFDDTSSFDPASNPGITLVSPTLVPWPGTSQTLPLTTDPVTLDTATGNILGSFTPASNIYSLSLNNVSLSQLPVNTGQALLWFHFNIEYQLDPAGLPLQPTLYPNFVVNGTVQPTPGSFAAVNGFIDYYGVNTAGTLTLLDTVNYNSTWNTPGSFIGTAFGVPVSGTTPALVGNTTLTLIGDIRFVVDPATINAETIPEPASLALLALGGLLLARRGRK